MILYILTGLGITYFMTGCTSKRNNTNDAFKEFDTVNFIEE